MSASADDRARFRREAKTISSLNHPHICVLHDIGQEGDADFLVMELVEGETLARRLTRGSLPPAETLQYGGQIADALDRAHRAGVIHRDLKPGNVMLTKSGAKLMDFGLARVAAHSRQVASGDMTATALGDQVDEPITAKGTVVGTFQYMAPEQLEGRDADARSDTWSLGCVLYEMATGKRAFEGATPASVISAIMRDQPREMAELAPLTPPALEQLVRACLAKDPEDRLQTAHDAKLQLQWIAEAGSKAGIPTSIQPRRVDRERIAWGVAGLLLLLGLVASLALWRSNQNKVERFTFTPLTFKPMTIFKAAFAPDGRTVVFSAATEGDTPRVFVVRPEYPEPQPVSDPGTAFLAVSSRGELAVLTETRYQIFPKFAGTLARMPLGGGAPREVLRGVHDADWFPDGSQLAIVRGMDSKDRLEFPIGNVLYEKSAGYLSDPRFSPKGDLIAFFDHPGMGDYGGSLSLVDLHGKRTVVSAGYSGLAGIAWSTDGRKVFFSGSRGGGDEVIYAATIGGGIHVALQSAGGPTLQDIGREGWLITRDDPRSSVMVHKPEWKEDRDLSWLDASQGGQLSRDGVFLVFTEQSEAVGDKSAVCLRKIDGSPVVRIGEGFSCTLSPDEKWVITRSGSPPTVLTLLPTGVGESKRLARGNIETYNHAWWFPNSDSILIRAQERGKPFRLYVQDLVGGLPHALTREKQFQAAIAPDGSWVMAKGGGGCFIYRFDGSAPQPVPWLNPNDQLLPWVVDTHSVLVIVGPWRQVPIHVERIDIATGHRSFFREISPPNRTGVLECNLTDFSDDFGCYAYDATSVFSSLFLVRPERHPHS
jgi:Tol biopolymer transport system component